MHLLRIQDRRYAQFERLRQVRGLSHGFSTRPDDVSTRQDDQRAQREARCWRIAADLGFDPARLCYCVQIHAARLEIVADPRTAGPLEGVDAVITALLGVPLMVFSADCPLVMAFDPVRRVVGLAHASWRCTVAAVTRRLIQSMQERCGCKPGAILAGIGPAAGPCCYEVQADVFEAAAALPDRERFFQTRAGRLYFDLWQANREQLVSAGVCPGNIEIAGICTLCRNDLFYSYRREGPSCGHFGLLAGVAQV